MFHDIRFPANLSFGATGGPERRTDIVTLASGFEERSSPWAHARRYYDAGLGLRSLDDLEALLGFFEARLGQLFGFRWKDWADYKSCAPSRSPTALDQLIAIGDGHQQSFGLQKTYVSGQAQYARPIKKPVLGTVLVAVEEDPKIEGLEFRVDTATGEIHFDVAPPLGTRISAGFEFDVPVRFDTPRIQVSVANFQAGEVPSVPVVEIRL